MGLKTTLETDMKQAMRDGDALRRDTLRMVLAALKNKAVELGNISIELSDEQVLDVLMSAVKTRTDSATQYAQAGRPDLEAKERSEIEMLQHYLPRQLDEQATREAVAAAVAETGASGKADMGKVMKAVMASHKGQVDGKLVSRLVAEALS